MSDVGRNTSEYIKVLIDECEFDLDDEIGWEMIRDLRAIKVNCVEVIRPVDPCMTPGLGHERRGY